jgi:hypothetical protein
MTASKKKRRPVRRPKPKFEPLDWRPVPQVPGQLEFELTPKKP